MLPPLEALTTKKSMMENFCLYCSVMVSSETELIEHCNSETHQLIIMSDEGREWKFRTPPRGVGSDQYVLCNSFSKTGKCGFAALCCYAHGEEELEEWKERFDYRQMKLQRAKECQLQGRQYTELLLEKWLTAPNPNVIMTDHLDSVGMSVEPETNLTIPEKNCCREWTFQLSAKASLRHVALLYETHRNHFRISYIKTQHSELTDFELGPNCQEWSSTENSSFNEESYIVKVRFVTAIYGTFRQDLVFDFGFEPVLVKKLCVDVVSITVMEKLQQAREEVVSYTERWSSADVTVIPFEKRPYPIGEQEKNLLACYPPPNGQKFTMTQNALETALTENNYCARQHELLNIEEMSQYELLSRYNVQATLTLVDRYLLTPNSTVTAKYAHGGELFANMTLTSVLSEDSQSGRLVLTNCSTVLIAPLSSKGEEHRKVYEAVIEDKGKTVIYIRLSKQCCEELSFKSDQEFVAEVQFQLNRLPLCEMHFAVDRLHPPSLVFPNVIVRPQLWNNHITLSSDVKLNPKQKEAVLAITTPLSARLPPVLIIGPFGTGKTYTLAQAVKIILSQENSRILVCTHSNSAADIYIREYLHPYVAEGKFEATPLRIYYRHRWVATVHPTVQQYCLINYNGNERSFVMPTIKDVKSRKVIVTTLSTARYLVQLGLEKGFFTHILIDEAAQAMECEAIMPLSLANENTRIVLAGDNMQLSPEVYSVFAQQRNLHTSLLERLYDLYPEDFPCKILLCENYRSHEAIIQYTSELFYDNHLKASAQQPRHEKYYPLTFFTARGEDIQDCNSTAFHNYAEVNEIVERVIELKKNWPSCWGEQDETSVCVVTPYYDQVVRIRAELRKKKLHGVSVERVLNVQGKQFRVIFLSAVRTRQTCGSKAESDLDHGFLSNARLLNTAITRAQSLVAVVGDPVSLCSVGKCRKLWEKFIYTCHKEQSLFGITWDSLRSLLDSMELRKNFILNPLALEFVPGRMYHGLPATSTANENFFPNVPPPQPLLFLSVPQGPPLIQPTMAMMPAPHPYLNCLVPPLLPTQPNPFQNYNFNSPAMPPPQQRPANITRMPPAAFPRKVMNAQRNVGPMEINPQMKEFENGLGRPLKRNDCLPYAVLGKQPPLGKPVDEQNQNEAEDMKRLVMNRLEHMNNFHFLNEAADNVTHLQNNQNHFNFEEKSKIPNMLKSDELPNGPMKNGMSNNEFNLGLFPDQMRNNKPPVNGIWGPLTPKSRFESEMHNSYINSYEEPNPGRTPFNEMNGVANDVDRPRTIFDPPNNHPMFMPPTTVDEQNQNEAEDMKRLVMNRLEHMNNFHFLNEAADNVTHLQNNQNHFNFEEKSKIPNMLKSDELPNGPMKNGMSNNEFNLGLFPDQMRNNKPPVNGIWGPLTPKSRFESEMHNSYINSYEEPNPGRTPFNEMNGVANDVDRPRTIFDPPNNHPMFMPPTTVDEQNQNEAEDMKRLVMNRLEHMNNFHFLNEAGDNVTHLQNNQNHFNFEEKSKIPNMLKSDELPNGPMKNGMSNNEFNLGLFPDQMRNNKPPVNGIWGPLTPKSRFESEMHNSYINSYEEPNPGRTPFNEMNGVANDVDRPRTIFDPPNNHPMFMPPTTVDEQNQNEAEDMKRLVMNRLEHMNNFHFLNEAGDNVTHLQNNQNHFNFEEKSKIPNMLKSDELPNGPMKNGMSNNEFNLGLFPDQMRNNKPPVNGIWGPLTPKSRFESEMHNSYINSYEEPNPGRTPFNEMNGVANDVDRSRTIFDPPNNHPMFMPPTTEKWPNSNESLQNANMPNVPLVNYPMVQTSLMEKLNLLQKVLPAGTDIPIFLDNEEQTMNFLQLLLATEGGAAAARTFSLLLVSIKRDQDVLQEVRLNNQKKLANRRYCSPSRNMQDIQLSQMRNMLYL